MPEEERGAAVQRFARDVDSAQRPVPAPDGGADGGAGAEADCELPGGMRGASLPAAGLGCHQGELMTAGALNCHARLKACDVCVSEGGVRHCATPVLGLLQPRQAQSCRDHCLAACAAPPLAHVLVATDAAVRGTDAALPAGLALLVSYDCPTRKARPPSPVPSAFGLRIPGVQRAISWRFRNLSLRPLVALAAVPLRQLAGEVPTERRWGRCTRLPVTLTSAQHS